MARLTKSKFRPKGRSYIPQELMGFGYHLVFSEGTQTEPNYIENIKQVIANNYQCSKGIIDIHPHIEDGSFNTLTLVKYAEDKVRQLLKEGQHIDHVWIFFDRDDFNKDNFDNACFKIEDKNKDCYENDDGDNCDENGIVWHACWSNECFELWVLLHFQNVTAAISRTKYIEMINSYIKNEKYGKYQKNNKHIFDLIQLNGGSMDKAIEYAKKLDVSSGPKQDPSTGVYLFAEHFKTYIYK